MFDKDSCFELGFIKRAIGLSGELLLFLDTDSPQNYLEMESVLVEEKSTGNLVPFFISSLSLANQDARVRFDGIDAAEEAKAWVGSRLFLPESVLPKLPEDQFYFHEVIGFMVEDKQHGKLGTVTSFINLPGNDLLEMNYNNKMVMFPVDRSIVSMVDREAKILKVDLPEGLLEIYLDED